jgi:hypothetical protein
LLLALLHFLMKSLPPGLVRKRSLPLATRENRVSLLMWMNVTGWRYRPGSCSVRMIQRPQLGLARPGAQLMVVGVVEGRHWLQIMLPDDSAVGFIHAEAITAAASAVGMPLDAETTSGTGQRQPRDFGYGDLPDRPAGRPSGGRGRFAGSVRDPTAKEPDRHAYVPIAKRRPVQLQITRWHGPRPVELVNGVARIMENASADYRHQQDEAEKNRRGIWATTGGHEVPAFARLAQWVGRMPSGEDPRAPTQPGIGSMFDDDGIAQAIDKNSSGRRSGTACSIDG